MPWDRAPLSNFESMVYDFMRERVASGFRVPGGLTIQRRFGCAQITARYVISSLVAKGWLGESGDVVQYTYINDKPPDIED